jgi:quinol monooxygenase YgiN
MIRIIAENYIRTNEVDKAEILFRELVAASRKDPGCFEYRVHKDDEVPGLYVFIEEWSDRIAHQKHDESEHFKRIIPQITAMASRRARVLILHDEVMV